MRNPAVPPLHGLSDHGVSVAVVHVDWARGYGVFQADRSAPVNTETLFQAASLSKPVTAVRLLSLVHSAA
ncbi:MAG: serine hydrolase [Bryobacteraceae bacterium]